MPIVLYQTRLSGPCRSVFMTIEQLGLDVVLKDIDLFEDEQLTAQFVKMNPAHTVPTLDDNGFILWESHAINKYLCNQYAPNSSLYPKDPKKRAIVDRWLNFDMSLIANQTVLNVSQTMSCAVPHLLLYQQYSKALGVDPPEDKATAHKKNLELLDQLIGSNKYLAGNDLTMADLSVLATLAYSDMIMYDLTAYKNIVRYRSQLRNEIKNYDAINVFDPQELIPAFAKFGEKLKAKLAKK